MGALELRKEILEMIKNEDDNSLVRLYELIKAYKQQRHLDTITYSNGKSFTKEQYIAHIDTISSNVRNGAKTSTTKEVKNFIFNS